MVYQIAWTRVLIMSLGSSTYSFTSILATFVLGIALGSLAAARWVDRWRDRVTVLGAVQLGIGLSAIMIAPIHERIPALVHRIVATYEESYSLILALEFALVAAVTLVPTFLMGATFPLVTRAIAGEGEEAASATGRAYAANTVGTILGAFLGGFVLIRGDVLGVQNSIVLAAVLNAAVGAWLVLRAGVEGAPGTRRTLVPIGGLVLVLLIAFSTGRWDRQALTSAPFLGNDRPLDAPLEHEVIYYRDGVDLTVAVAEWPGDPKLLSLRVNGKADASTRIWDMVTQLLITHLAALQDSGGKQACVIGLGSGMSAGVLPRYPTYQRIDCVELSDEVIAAADYFSEYTYDVLRDSRVNLIRADGRNHLSLSPAQYDIILSEPSNPWIAGIANLFTTEFFELCKRRLTDDGLLGVWLHSYRMSVEDFQMVAHTLFEVFDAVSVWEMSSESDYLFLAANSPPGTPLDQVVQRFRIPEVRADLYRVGLARLDQILGKFITSGEPLRAWAAQAPINTDDNARLEFSAPRSMYAHDEVDIAKELYALGRSPFDEWIEADPDREDHRQLVRRVEDVARSRVVRLDIVIARDGMDFASHLRALLDAYELDPGGPEMYQYLHEMRQSIRSEASHVVLSPEVAPLLTRMDDLRLPVFAKKTGASLAEIAAALEVFATDAKEGGALNAAFEYLYAAYDIMPDDARIARSAARAAAEASRADEAIALLDRHLRTHPDDEETRALRAELVDAGDN